MLRVQLKSRGRKRYHTLREFHTLADAQACMYRVAMLPETRYRIVDPDKGVVDEVYVPLYGGESK